MHAAALALLLAAAQPAPSTGARLVVSTGLRVRAAPSPDAPLVEKVPIGTVLPCTERSADVTVGDKTGAFCKAPTGWYYEPLTAPVEADLDAQLRRLISERGPQQNTIDEAKRPDAYEFHRFLLRRVADAGTKDARARAQLDELRFVDAHAEAFQKDPRVHRDYAQGWRATYQAYERLEQQAAGTSVYDDAGWARVEHGGGGECEGDAACGLDRVRQMECAYLERHPRGAHAAGARRVVVDALKWGAEATAKDEDAAAELDALRACAAETKTATREPPSRSSPPSKK